MLDSITKKRIDDCRDILVGKVPDPKSQIEQITIALIYKFMDDMDMEAVDLGGEREFFSGEYERFAWRNLFHSGLSGIDRVKLYDEAVEGMETNPYIPPLFRNIFKNAYLPYRDPETLRDFLKYINDFTYDHSEKLGDAFEYLLSILGSQGDAGQFRTPRHIIDFMASMMEPTKAETILDPACGTAGFLISAFKHIQKANSSNFDPETDKHAFEQHGVKLDELTVNGKHYKGDLLTPDERTRMTNQIKGYDISPDMVRLSLVNLYFHGFKEPHIYEYDTLTSEDRWNEYYDVILANPPFMSPKGGIRPHKLFSVQSKRSEVLFVDYMAEHLTAKGRAAIIVPEGIIFQSGTAYKSLRKMLVDEHFLVGVISLPAGMFNPYSGVKTSILWLDKTLARKSNNILFVKIENDGFDLGAQRRPIKQNDLPEAYKKITAYKNALRNGEYIDFDDDSMVSVVSKKEIGSNGEYNLGGERYKTKKEEAKYAYVNLGDICNNYDGKRVPITKSERKEGLFPYYGASGIVDYVDDYLFDENLLLVSEDGANLLARVTPIAFSVKGKFWVNNHAHVLKFENRITQIYVEYLLNNISLENYITGSAQPKLNQKALNSIQVPLPPLSIQEEIVAEIERYQKIIDGARQVVSNYKPRIDIDPNWEMVELGEVFNKITSSVTPNELDVNSIIYIGLENISKGSGELVGDLHSNPKEIKSTKTAFQQNDILYGKLRPNLNKVYYSEIEGICSTDIFVLRGNNKVVPQFYSSYFLSESFNQEVVIGLKGAQLPRVGYEYFSKIIIPLPPISTQQQIVTRIEQEQALVNANKQLIELFEQRIKDRMAKVWGE